MSISTNKFKSWNADRDSGGHQVIIKALHVVGHASAVAGITILLSGCTYLGDAIYDAEKALSASHVACGTPFEMKRYTRVTNTFGELFANRPPVGSDPEYDEKLQEAYYAVITYIADANAAAEECRRKKKAREAFSSTVRMPPLPPYFDEDVYGSTDITVPEPPKPVHKPKATAPKKVFIAPPPPPPPPVYVPPCA